MMKEICIINQCAGLGDIFYTQKIAKLIIKHKKADRVIWPVKDCFIYLKDYLVGDNIEYVEESNFIKPEKSFEVNLNTADQRYPYMSVMLAKYAEVGLKDNNWLDYFDFKRNKVREEKFYNTLITTKDYIVRNAFFGSPPDPYELKEEIPYNGDKQIIDIDFYNDTNLFDWCKILENAAELHMVDTSFMYILEKLNLNCSIKKLYSRFNPADFSHIEHVPQKINWDFTRW